jgi:molecular chaperone IbpA
MFGTNSVTYSIPDTAKYLLEIQRNSIGLDEWFKRFDSTCETHTNYPPYNLIQESSTEFTLEIALSGYKKEDIIVTTEWNKLFVECKKAPTEYEYLHNGIARRAFTRTWTLSDDVVVEKISFEDGLLIIKLNKVIPDHQKKRTYDII